MPAASAHQRHLLLLPPSTGVHVFLLDFEAPAFSTATNLSPIPALIGQEIMSLSLLIRLPIYNLSANVN